MYRQERSRPNANEIPTMLSKSSLTNSLNSISVLHHIHPSTPAQHSKSVLLTEANITPSTRVLSVLFAEFARLERTGVGLSSWRENLLGKQARKWSSEK